MSDPQHDLGRELGGRFSTAVVLFHAAAAERIGLNVTDYKCAEILHRLGPTNPSRLAATTGMSSAAVAQVINRLERAGLARREPDPSDGRRTLVHPADGGPAHAELTHLFATFAHRLGAITATYTPAELATLTDFVTRTTEVLEDEALRLRTP